MVLAKRLSTSIGALAMGIGWVSIAISPAARAGMNQFMQACMNEGASYSYCQCAAEHIIGGATVYQAATLCNRRLAAPSGSSGGSEYRGNNVACMMMRDEPMMLAATGCY